MHFCFFKNRNDKRDLPIRGCDVQRLAGSSTRFDRSVPGAAAASAMWSFVLVPTWRQLPEKRNRIRYPGQKSKMSGHQSCRGQRSPFLAPYRTRAADTCGESRTTLGNDAGMFPPPALPPAASVRRGPPLPGHLRRGADPHSEGTT